MTQTYSRREMLRLTGGAAAGLLTPQLGWGAERKGPVSAGAITGDPDGARVGEQILKDGGNAVDAVIAAALTTCVVSASKCGPGGYGGHMTIAPAKGKVACIDFNSTAPAAARPEMFPVDAQGRVQGNTNALGWLAAGVPGTLAGMELALKRYGTRSFRELAGPAIALARDGFPVSKSLALALRSTAPQLRKFPASAQLLLKDGQPYVEGETFRNPELAKMLETLAERNSVDSFYRGDIAQQIAEAFAKNGGLVTTKDLAAYRAREIAPLKLKLGELAIYTAPLTAGGLTVVEALAILEAMEWGTMRPALERSQARLEALRIAWRDRLSLLGDPEKTEVPVSKLMSAAYARESAGEVALAVREKRPVPMQIRKEHDDGTMNLSCVDGQGNMVAMTLTHGGSFGSKATVEGLGVVLGHGMSRFDPVSGRPNSVGPGKRPLHNMCPTVVLRDSRPVMALGAAGGRLIPNAVFDVLIEYALSGKAMREAVASPRLNTEGDLNLRLEKSWPTVEMEFFQKLGYKLQTGPGAVLSAVAFEPKSGECAGAMR